MYKFRVVGIDTYLLPCGLQTIMDFSLTTLPVETALIFCKLWTWAMDCMFIKYIYKECIYAAFTLVGFVFLCSFFFFFFRRSEIELRGSFTAQISSISSEKWHTPFMTHLWLIIFFLIARTFFSSLIVRKFTYLSRGVSQRVKEGVININDLKHKRSDQTIVHRICISILCI